jgi:integrase
MPKKPKEFRRANGQGAVIKFGGNRRKPFTVRFSNGKSLSGKRLYKYLGWYEKAEDAEKARQLYVLRPDLFAEKERSEVTLQDLYDSWSKTEFSGDINPHTKTTWETAWKRLRPISKMRMYNMRLSVIQNLIDDLADHGKSDYITRCINQRKNITDREKQKLIANVEDEGLSNSSLGKIKNLASLLCRLAMGDDIIDKDYAALVKLPPNVTKKKVIWDDLERAKIEKAAADGDMTAQYIMVMFYTGWRINELLSLTIFNYKPGDKAFVGGEKTDAGIDRLVPVHPKIQKYVDIAIGRNGDTVFCNENGRGFTVNNFRTHYYYPALERLKVRRFVPHTTRYVFHHLMEEAMIPQLRREMLAGHTDIKMTKRYTPSDVTLLREAINKLK